MAINNSGHVPSSDDGFKRKKKGVAFEQIGHLFYIMADEFHCVFRLNIYYRVIINLIAQITP